MRTSSLTTSIIAATGYGLLAFWGVLVWVLASTLALGIRIPFEGAPEDAGADAWVVTLSVLLLQCVLTFAAARWTMRSRQRTRLVMTAVILTGPVLLWLLMLLLTFGPRAAAELASTSQAIWLIADEPGEFGKLTALLLVPSLLAVAGLRLTQAVSDSDASGL